MESGVAAGATPRLQHQAPGRPTFELGLIGGFSLRRNGEPVHLPLSVQRLVAFLALSKRAVMRSHAAGTFWPDVSEARAMANLRSVIWRLPGPSHEILVFDGGLIALRPEVGVDARRLSRAAHVILEATDDAGADDVEPLIDAGELLPDWSDQWVIVDREHYHQLRVHALERLCQRRAASGRVGLAVEACLAALAAEPARESTQRQLIEIYLAEGNRADALRQYASYRRVIRDEVGVEPSREITDLVRAGAIVDGGRNQAR